MHPTSAIGAFEAQDVRLLEYLMLSLIIISYGYILWYDISYNVSCGNLYSLPEIVFLFGIASATFY